MSTLHVEPFSGLSGDMFLGALCGLADAYDEVADFPKIIGLPDGKVTVSQVEKNGIACQHVEVIDLNEHTDPHSHHHGAHRHLSDIIAIIEAADIPKSAKQIAKDIFLLIGEAESSVHSIPLDKIHFHEISAVDSIIDIVGSAILLDRLKIEKCYSRPICTGFGMVQTQHGQLPVPAPATALLLQGLPTYQGDEKGERVTPTGAAILRYLNPDFKDTPSVIEKTAYGPGKKTFISPNVLRLSLSPSTATEESLYCIESNLDDATPESLGASFQEGLLAAGAIDFTLSHVTMKKGRLGIHLQTLAHQSKRQAVTDYILEQTTTIGLRYYKVERKILDRKTETVHTPYGPLTLKIVTTPSGSKRHKIEHDDLVSLARANNVPIITIQKCAEAQFKTQA